MPTLKELSTLSDADLLAHVQKFMAPRYEEGYVKGVHDRDAAKILKSLLTLHNELDLLRYPPRVRACARVYWRAFANDDVKSLWTARFVALYGVTQLFPDTKHWHEYIATIHNEIADFLQNTRLFPLEMAPNAAEYLFYELTDDDPPTHPGHGFVVSSEAAKLRDSFLNHLRQKGFLPKFDDAIVKLKEDPVGKFEVIRSWLKGYLDAQADADLTDYRDEAVALLFCDLREVDPTAEISTRQELINMSGDHPQVEKGAYRLDYHDFMTRMDQHEAKTVPQYQAYQSLKKKLNDQFREDLRLDEFKPRVLSSFVRNQLIDKVYLPLIGDNLAKQIGVVGDNTRTDRMGLLLLISPPGYGKTTLMEYIANRLGIVFMKINGPAIGHRVTSLDPAQAPNASAREEMEKLNLALEMGDNVMLYLDDIQHCNPELLQKFISLCDAQRKIEGVYKGRTRTYDLRGKKVCVVMAGNPYTESGEKFQIPDMLANRADTYNLGDIIGDTYDSFVLSYLENSLTSNPVLNKLATKSQKDVYNFIRMAESGTKEGLEFEATYSVEEMNEYVAVLKKLLVVRDIVLKVNQQYIKSAAQEDAYRTEPRFQLQGSYRNMNKMAARVLPIMNDEELQTLILSHYEQEAQTLTSGAEANLLKFKELMGIQTTEEAKRWADIKKKFEKNQLFKGKDETDPVVQLMVQLGTFKDGLDNIHEALQTNAITSGLDNIQEALKNDAVRQGLESIRQTIEAGLKAQQELQKAREGEKKVVVVRKKE